MGNSTAAASLLAATLLACATCSGTTWYVCRDAGLTLPGQSAETDVLGNPRVRYDGVDMGALECCLSLGGSILVR